MTDVLANIHIWKAISRFAVDYPFYATPDGAKDQCHSAACRFMEYAVAEGCEDCEVIAGYHVDKDGAVLWDHSVLRIGDRVYDWTARQFYPPADWPTVVSLQRWQQFIVNGDGDGRAT